MMNVAQYAARRGCSERAVRKAIEAGRITATRVGRAWSIDPVQADQQWQERTDPVQGGKHDADAGEARQAASAAAAASAEDGAEEGGIEPLTESRKKWSHHRARLAETEAELGAIKLKVERGELVDAELERQNGFRIARAFRDRMMNIPDRLASTLAAEADAALIHHTLTAEIREACLELAALDLDAAPAAPD